MAIHLQSVKIWLHSRARLRNAGSSIAYVNTFDHQELRSLSLLMRIQLNTPLKSISFIEIARRWFELPTHITTFLRKSTSLKNDREKLKRASYVKFLIFVPAPYAVHRCRTHYSSFTRAEILKQQAINLKSYFQLSERTIDGGILCLTIHSYQ